jgi:NADH dehydrogenase FAD-containing subunit
VQAITLVGGGAAGVELALAMSWRLREIAPRPHVRILEHRPAILSEFPAGARARLGARLRREGIGVHPASTVREVGPGYVRLASGIEFATDATFWTAGATGPAWLAESGLATSPAGFVRTNERLQSVSNAEVFAAGDCAVDDRHPMPRAGAYAVRAGPALERNLRAFLEGRPLEPYVPRRRSLALIGTGGRHAVGTWGPLSWQGRWAWRWKERIDREWLAGLRPPSP